MSSKMWRGVILAITATRFIACAPDPVGIVVPPSHEGGAGDGASSEPPWCNVQRVLAQKCQRCHQDPPKNGAPFSLMTYEDTQVLDRAGTPRYERMYDAVESEFMPATFVKLDPPVAPLTDAERALLLEWASSGGQATGGTSCD
jgi:uncharacterized membrane protein